MPPTTTPPLNPNQPQTPQKKTGVGPMIGTIIIVILLIFGGLYFWGAQLNKEKNQDQLPFIPGDPQ